MISKTDPLGNVTTYTYDALGHRLSETDPLSHTHSFVYDAVGNLIAETNALGIRISARTYNSRDLPTAVARMAQATRRLAKRQITWFRGDPTALWREPVLQAIEPVAHELFR